MNIIKKILTISLALVIASSFGAALLVMPDMVAAAGPENDLGTVPPPPSGSGGVVYNSPSFEQTIDHGDGTYTFEQQVDENSSPPHWVSPGSYGFEIYSWYDEDYGWMHDFPNYADPGLLITSATLTIRAWDVDSEVSHGYYGEFDGVFGDGVYLNPQYLQGTNENWSVTIFDVDPNSLLDGELDIWLDIDMHHTEDWWATTVDYSYLTVNYTYSTNSPPYQPTLARSPAGCVYDGDDLVVTVTGPTPADLDGDTVTYEYRWLVDTGTGFYVDDEFAGRGDHTGNTVPAADTQNGDKWKVEVTPVDEHGTHGTKNSVAFTEIGSCLSPPIADAGSDQTLCPGIVTLDGSASYDSDGTIISYLWELWDGATWNTIGSAAVIDYNFATVGIYSVRLTVEDNDGLTDEALVYVTVEQCIPDADICPDEYRWSTLASPVYEWDPFPLLFRSWNQVKLINNGPGDVFSVTATITCAPLNVNIVDGNLTFGDISEGGGAWSIDDFVLETDMTNPQDPNKGICWTIEYDDASGVHHVLRNVAKFCGEECSNICP